MEIQVTLTLDDGRHFGMRSKVDDEIGGIKQADVRMVCEHLTRSLLATLYGEGKLLLDSPRHGDRSA